MRVRTRPWPLGFLVAAVLTATPASATERVVTDCGDTVPGGDPGQLRRLINDATTPARVT